MKSKIPGKPCPRALLLSIFLVGCLYVVMNVSILGVVPWQEMVQTAQSNARLYVISTLWNGFMGRSRVELATALVMWTAFASVFSLMLGYSRVPYAAALDGNYFRAFCPRSFQTPVPVCFAAGPGRRGRGLLLFLSSGRDCSAGRGAHSAAVSGAGDRTDRFAFYATGFGAALSHVALSAAGVGGQLRVSLHSVLAQELSEGNPLRVGDLTSRCDDLYGAGVAKPRMAICSRGGGGTVSMGGT